MFGGTPICSAAIRTGQNSSHSPRPDYPPRSRHSSMGPWTNSATCSMNGRSIGSCAICPRRCGSFSKRRKLFALIIPKQYGGLGFSAYAHSEIIRKLSTRSICGAVTAMVPNSLGPGELLHQFGTKEQQDYWLPRLAEGSEFPASGSPARRPARMRLPCSIPALFAAACGKVARRSASGSTGTSATSRLRPLRLSWDSPSSSTIPITSLASRRRSASPSHWFRPAFRG